MTAKTYHELLYWLSNIENDTTVSPEIKIRWIVAFLRSLLIELEPPEAE